LRCAPPPRFARHSINAAAIALPLSRCAPPPLFAPPPPPLCRQAFAPLRFSGLPNSQYAGAVCSLLNFLGDERCAMALEITSIFVKKRPILCMTEKKHKKGNP
jgi:hypothetical protein